MDVDREGDPGSTAFPEDATNFGEHADSWRSAQDAPVRPVVDAEPDERPAVRPPPPAPGTAARSVPAPAVQAPPPVEVPPAPVQPVSRPPRRSVLDELWADIQRWFAPAPQPELLRVRRAIILGPARTGKTAVLSACGRACTLGTGGPYDLWFRSNNDAMSTLIQQGVNGLIGADEVHRATANESLHVYEFTAEGVLPRVGKVPERPFEMKVTLSDTGGGVVFPPEGNSPNRDRRGTILAQGADSEVLVFCFDLATYWSVALTSHLHGVLQEMAKDTGKLRAQRILILLNKADQMAAGVLSAMRASGRPLSEHVTERDVAAGLDPVPLAIEVLGPGQLGIFRGYAPHATLAVGVCSASGFTPEGHPLLDARGFPIRADGGRELDPNVFLDKWRPFGIREALLFMASGEALGPVRIVTRGDIEVADGPARRMPIYL